MMTEQELNEMEYQTQKYVESSGQNMASTLKVINCARELLKEAKILERVEQDVDSILSMYGLDIQIEEFARGRESAYQYIRDLISEVRNG